MSPATAQALHMLEQAGAGFRDRITTHLKECPSDHRLIMEVILKIHGAGKGNEVSALVDVLTQPHFERVHDMVIGLVVSGYSNVATWALEELERRDDGEQYDNEEGVHEGGDAGGGETPGT